MAVDMFEKASRLKLRFMYKGQISVEDLWDLDVEVIDRIYQQLAEELNAADNRGSLLKTKSQRKNRAIKTLALQIDILKYIAEVKQTEADNQEKKHIRAEQRQKILGIIAEKQDRALQDKSVEELLSLIGQEAEGDNEEDL